MTTRRDEGAFAEHRRPKSAHLGMRRDDLAWQTDAACRDMNPELFFDMHPDPLVFAVCDSCPVTDTCRAYADRWAIGHGVWGGIQMENQRKVISGTCSNGHERTPETTRLTANGYRKCRECERERARRNRRRGSNEKAA